MGLAIRMSCLALIITMSAAAAAAAAAAVEPEAVSGDPYVVRKTVFINTVRGKVALKFPRLKPVPLGFASGFRRTWNDTCGLLDIIQTVYSPSDNGPPPHIHYNDDEWFFLIGAGKLRMYTHSQARRYLPGELPGFNLPPQSVGSAVLQSGDVLYSPKGSVHYFYRETETTDFFAVHASGFAMEIVLGMFASYNNISQAQELMANTGLYGIPHDFTAKFVGANGMDEARLLRGPVDAASSYAGDPQLRRLQRLFDMADRQECYSGTWYPGKDTPGKPGGDYPGGYHGKL